MAKRKWKMFLVAFGLILLVSCKPSDKYTGDWYAVSASGDKVMINFSKEKVMTLSDEEGNEEVYEMNQTASGIQNSTRYFRVEIDGDRKSTRLNSSHVSIS